MRMDARPLIRLWSSRGPGVIIPCESGVVYTNQTGGHGCLHPQCEGVYAPLFDESVDIEGELYDFFYNGKKWQGWCHDGIDEETADVVDSILQKSAHTKGLRVDRARLAESHEAWIHVRMLGDDDRPIEIRGFGTDSAILTWSNSD